MHHTGARVFLFLLLVTAVGAQTTTGTLDGRVTGGDGFGLPGVVITVSGGPLADSRTASTDGNGDYSVPNLPPGEYKVTALLEGFATSVRNGVSVSVGRNSRADFQLQLAEVVEEIIIVSTTNAATNLNPALTGSELPRGGIVNLWGTGVGPETLTKNPTTPFSKSVGGYNIFVEVDGERHDAFPLFVSRHQSAAILSSQTPLGPGYLYVENDSRTSNRFHINVVDHQPGCFVQDGKSTGIFTRLDFSLITPQSPAVPGEYVTGWCTGFAPGVFDDRPGVFDMRDALADFTYYIGGIPVADADIAYIGSGGAPGVVQWTGKVPANVEPGCGVTFAAHRGLPGGQPILSNVVTLPVSPNGAPCGDVHGLPGNLVDLLDERPVNLTTAVMTEFGVFDGSERVDYLTARLFGQAVTASSYVPPAPLGSCHYQWHPTNFQDPFAPAELEFGGSYTMTLPWAQIELSPNSSRGPFAELFTRPAPEAMTDGAYRYTTSSDFQADGSASSIQGGGTYRRTAGRLRGSIEEYILSTYRDRGFVSLSQVIDEVLQAGGGEPGTVLDYQLFADGGPSGTHLMRCLGAADSASLTASRETLLEQSWRIMSANLNGRFESGNLGIRTFSLDTNRGPRGPGLDSGEEVFDAVMSLALDPDAVPAAVADCAAFATCP